jgi:hypothetical protein
MFFAEARFIQFILSSAAADVLGLYPFILMFFMFFGIPAFLTNHTSLNTTIEALIPMHRLIGASPLADSNVFLSNLFNPPGGL